MASINALEWIGGHLEHVGADLLEVGSKKYKEHAFLDLKTYLGERHQKAFSIVGCDISPGDNVDVTVDLTGPRQEVLDAFGRKFDTVFCVSVL
jgi:hypothetical protein